MAGVIDDQTVSECEENKIDELTQKLSNDASLVNGRDKFNRTLVYVAAKNNHPEMIRLLYEMGADINATQWCKSTPLHTATFYKKKEASEMLLSLNARQDLKNNYGMTPKEESAEFWKTLQMPTAVSFVDKMVITFQNFFVTVHYDDKIPQELKQVHATLEFGLNLLTNAMEGQGVPKTAILSGETILKKAPDDKLKPAKLNDKDLSPALALTMYTTNYFYQNLNSCLRGALCDVETMIRWSLISRHIVRGLFSLPATNQKVYRGVRFTGDRALYQEHATVVWKSFSSTTTNLTTAKNFGGNGHLFIINTSNAKDISFLSQYPGEAEWLLTAGTGFKVKKVTPQHPSYNNAYTIEMEEIVIW